MNMIKLKWLTLSYEEFELFYNDIKVLFRSEYEFGEVKIKK